MAYFSDFIDNTFPTFNSFVILFVGLSFEISGDIKIEIGSQKAHISLSFVK